MHRLVLLLLFFLLCLLSILLLWFASTHPRSIYPIDAFEAKKSNPQDDFRAFESPSGDFKILLPTIPQRAEERIDLVHYEMYSSLDPAGSTYLVTVIHHAESAPQNKDLLGTVLSGLIDREREVLEDLTREAYGIYPAVHFAIRGPTKLIRGRAILVRRTVYLLMYSAEVDAFREDYLNTFINSFSLTESLPHAR